MRSSRFAARIDSWMLRRGPVPHFGASFSSSSRRAIAIKNCGSEPGRNGSHSSALAAVKDILDSAWTNFPRTPGRPCRK